MKTGTKIQVTTYRGEPVANGALSAPELPNRLKLLPWGESTSTKGRVFVGRKTLTTLSAMQRELGFERVALDFEHNTVPGTRAYKESAEPRPVAAYGTVLVLEGEGLFLDNLAWTPTGILTARNFEDLSPAVKQDSAGEVLFMHSAALTRNGSVYDLTFFSVGIEVETQTQEEIAGMKEQLLKLLGLAPEATDEEITVAVDKAAALLKMLSGLTAEAVNALSAISAMDLQAKLTVLSAVSDSGKSTIEGLVTKVGEIEKSLQVFSAEKVKSERGAIRARAAREGKVIPLSAEQIEAMDLVVLSTLVEKLPATVPVEQRTIEDVRTHAATGVETGGNRAEIFRNCGLKAEEGNG